MSSSLNKILAKAPLGKVSLGNDWLNMLFNPAANIAQYGETGIETEQKQEDAMNKQLENNRKISPYTNEEEDPDVIARREFYQKQALLASRKNTIKTTSLGVASDTLQTSRKALLGGA
jgi:hypothetical protein